MILIPLKWIPQIRVHLCPLQCAEIYPEVFAGTIAAILD